MTSTELWECLNTTYNALAERERAAKGLGPHEFFSFIEGRAAMFAGLADSTLSRDDGYRFMVLGRAIERVDMTVRLLLSRVGDSASSPAWVTVLRSAGAHDTYLRTYRGVRDAGRVVEFILLDRLFPRSVFYSLRLAEHSLEELDRRPHSRWEPPPKHSGCSAAPAASWSSCVPACCWKPWSSDWPDCRGACRDIGEAVALQYFHSAPWVAWVDAGRHNGALVIEDGEILMWRMRVVHSTGYAYKGTVNLRSCGRSANHISLIRHTRPGESRRRTGENRPRLLKLTVPSGHRCRRDARAGDVPVRCSRRRGRSSAEVGGRGLRGSRRDRDGGG